MKDRPAADSPPAIRTLQNLADAAGVSRATASRALNNNPRIAIATREKIQSLAARHGYLINRRARDLRLKRSSVVSVVFMLDIRSKQHMSDLFFLDMLGAIADALAARDYDLLLAHAPVIDAAQLANSRAMLQSDGVIFIGQERQHEQLNLLADAGRPIVVWGHPVPDKRYVVIGGDNFAGGKQAACHLIETGRRRIAFFGNISNPENAARYAGYREALAEGGVAYDASLHFEVPFSMERARESITTLLSDRGDFDAVVCISDVVALATISAAQRQGLSVPGDIAVTGYDDIGLASYSSPTLTTVRQGISTAGEELVNTLLKMIDGERPVDTMLSTELVIRESTAGLADTDNP
ncbi:LacI family DNA-binding transcriptional regulator [Congregibacter sp.]|uniref:LacI family DNA-binding transcriptional regulator n=1 Tax=Congregibacter sp. TaxID=2744308 RepID=UPI003F6CCD51